MIQSSEQLVHIHFHTHGFRKFTENIYPCIQVRGTVVGMCHCHRMSGRSCHHIDFLIRSGQLFFQNDRGKCGSSRRNISGTLCHAVGCHHSGSRVSFRRTHRNACFQFSAYVQKLCTCFGKAAGILSGNQTLRQDITKLPWETIRCHQLVKLLYHCLVIILCAAVYREHTCNISDSQNSLPGELPVYISFQRSNIINILYMLFPV